MIRFKPLSSWPYICTPICSLANGVGGGRGGDVWTEKFHIPKNNLAQHLNLCKSFPFPWGFNKKFYILQRKGGSLNCLLFEQKAPKIFRVLKTVEQICGAEFDIKQEMEEYFVLDAGKEINFLCEDVKRFGISKLIFNFSHLSVHFKASFPLAISSLRQCGAPLP